MRKQKRKKIQKNLISHGIWLCMIKNPGYKMEGAIMK